MFYMRNYRCLISLVFAIILVREGVASGGDPTVDYYRRHRPPTPYSPSITKTNSDDDIKEETPYPTCSALSNIPTATSGLTSRISNIFSKRGILYCKVAALMTGMVALYILMIGPFSNVTCLECDDLG